MVDELSGGKVMYAFLRVTDPNTQLPKNVLVNWVRTIENTTALTDWTRKLSHIHTHTHTCTRTHTHMYTHTCTHTHTCAHTHTHTHTIHTFMCPIVR